MFNGIYYFGGIPYENWWPTNLSIFANTQIILYGNKTIATMKALLFKLQKQFL